MGIIEFCDIRQIACDETTLARFRNEEVFKGRYEFPFILTVPPNALGSHGQIISGTHYAVQYLVRAELERPGNIMYSKVTNELEVRVLHPPVSGPPEPSESDPFTMPMFFCSCLRTGDLQVTAIVDNTSLAMQEIINLDLGINNTSRSAIKAVEISLIENVHGHAEGHGFCFPTTLSLLTVPAADIPGAAKSNRPKNVYQAAAAEVGRLHILVPWCRPTCEGELGSVSHMLTVKVIMRWGWFHPTIEIPLVVSSYRLANSCNMEDSRQRQRANRHRSSSPAGEALAVGTVLAVSTASLEGEAAAPPDPDSLQSLIRQLLQGDPSSEVDTVESWLSKGGSNPELMTAQQLEKVFRCVRRKQSYSRLTTLFGAAMYGHLTLRHVASAARGTPENRKSVVCITFAQYVRNKAQARVLLEEAAGLSGAELERVLAYYE